MKDPNEFVPECNSKLATNRCGLYFPCLYAKGVMPCSWRHSVRTSDNKCSYAEVINATMDNCTCKHAQKESVEKYLNLVFEIRGFKEEARDR